MRPCIVRGYNGTACKAGPGGIVRSAVIQLVNVLTIVFTGDKITAVTIEDGTAFEEWRYSDDNTAQYVETPPTRESSINSQVFTGQFYSVTLDGIMVADGVNSCCDGLMLIHEYGDGSLRYQGIDRHLATGLVQWKRANQAARAWIGTNSGVANTKGFMPITVDSAAYYLSPVGDETLFDIDDALAL